MTTNQSLRLGENVSLYGFESDGETPIIGQLVGFGQYGKEDGTEEFAQAGLMYLTIEVRREDVMDPDAVASLKRSDAKQ